MEYNDIRALLGKYWACESTEEEEEALRVFYAGHEGALPADLQEAAPLFRYFHDCSDVPEMPELFTDRPAPWDEPPAIVRPIWQNWMKYAAAVLVAGGLLYSADSFRDKQSDELAFRDTYSDPKLAYEQTQRALQLLSKNLNRGKTQMEKIGYFSEATEKVQGKN
ncbi:hypothetical protein [Chitinophaga deserti]|uniref:hypothetical protein n=1 Tax=Chitinophaga deserti TaxID=2164099 RepID=UPI000D6BDA74|nr:hypothetical protein [Chitinophaga deserti]